MLVCIMNASTPRIVCGSNKMWLLSNPFISSDVFWQKTYFTSLNHLLTTCIKYAHGFCGFFGDFHCYWTKPKPSRAPKTRKQPWSLARIAMGYFWSPQYLARGNDDVISSGKRPSRHFILASITIEAVPRDLNLAASTLENVEDSPIEQVVVQVKRLGIDA